MKNPIKLLALVAALCLPFALLAQAAPDYTASANVGQTSTFTVTVASGTQPFSYQWKKNGTPIAGATAASLVLPNLQTTDSGVYLVTVANVAGATDSNKCTLTVSPVPPAGVTTTATVK